MSHIMPSAIKQRDISVKRKQCIKTNLKNAIGTLWWTVHKCSGTCLGQQCDMLQT